MALLRRKQTADTRRLDQAHLGRTEEASDLEIVAASGSHVRDARGRTLIDLEMGWCVGNLGWNPPEILARVQQFSGPSYVSPKQLYAPWAELAKRLVTIAPGELSRAFRCVGGSEAVDLALQLAMTSTGRTKIVSLEDAYHGNTFGARSVGAEDLDATLPGMKKLAPPLDMNALARLERLLAARDVAAFIMEPIVMNLDVLIPDSDFMVHVVELCHRYGTLVIADEVACGMGRTGKLFASEHYHLAPDLLTIGKSLGGGVAPIAAVLTTEEVADTDEDYSFYSTFGWMPIATEAALATLDYWAEHGDELLANSAERSHQFRRGLAEIFPDVEVRVMGLAIGIDVGDGASEIGERCRDKGLLVSDEEDALMMMPALTIDAKTVDQALSILRRVVR